MLGQNDTVTVKRISQVNGKSSYTDIISQNLEVFLIQQSLEKAVFWGEQSVFDIYDMFIDGLADIKVSDQVTDSEGNIYYVNGVKKMKGGDVPNHTEVVLKRTNKPIT